MTWQRHGAGGQVGRAGRRPSVLVFLWTAFLALSMVLSACGADAHQPAAQQNKAKLDRELQHASKDLGIPDSMLKPIVTQEQATAAGADGWNYNYQSAAANYTLLYNQLIGIEQTATQTLRQQATSDIEAFTRALNERRSQGFIEANAYQARLDQALKDFQNAKTPGDYARIDALARSQTSALNALWPAYQKLQTFKATLHAMETAGINSSFGEIEYTQDLQVFRDASSADRYQKLVGVIDGQITQMMADQTEALPYIGSALLDTFQANIDNLKRWGENATTFQAQHDQDARSLASAHTLSDYLALSQTINKQTSAMALPLVRGQARNDLKVLQQLINTAQADNPLNAYEYANGDEGIGNVQGEFNQASSVNDYESADEDINSLITNLRALLDNLHDSTAPWLPHKADQQLLQYYHIMSGKVIVISLREQTARFYDNGKMVYWTYITSGRPERPSPPGLHYAMEKDYHIEFKSSDPPGSPLWYAPTAINYAILYANYGYFIHDAWWRYKFGPGSNLPHWDPLAFNGGSHGCVNVPEDNMVWVYNWTPVGAPIVIY